MNTGTIVFIVTLIVVLIFVILPLILFLTIWKKVIKRTKWCLNKDKTNCYGIQDSKSCKKGEIKFNYLDKCSDKIYENYENYEKK